MAGNERSLMCSYDVWAKELTGLCGKKQRCEGHSLVPFGGA